MCLENELNLRYVDLLSTTEPCSIRNFLLTMGYGCELRNPQLYQMLEASDPELVQRYILLSQLSPHRNYMVYLIICIVLFPL